MKERINIDFLKSVGIIAVVLGHFANPFGVFIFSWHMPLFFIASGYLTNSNQPFKGFLKRNFKRLMYPFFIWEIFSIATLYPKDLLLHRPIPNLLHVVYKSFLWMNYDNLLDQYGFVLWFLPALFTGRILLYGVLKITSNTLIMIGIAVTLFIISFGFVAFFNIDIGINIFLWLLLGRLTLQNSPTFFLINKVAFVFLLLLGVFCLYYTLGIPVLNLSQKQYSNHIPYNFLWAFLIIFIIKEIGDLHMIKNIKLINFLSKQSMAIFIFHPYTNNIANALLKGHVLDNLLWVPELIVSLILIFMIIMILEKLKLSKKLCLTL